MSNVVLKEMYLIILSGVKCNILNDFKSLNLAKFK